MSLYGRFQDSQLWLIQIVPIMVLGLIYLIIQINHHYASEKEYNRTWEATVTYKGLGERNAPYIIIKNFTGEIYHKAYPQFENSYIFNSIQLNDTLYKPIHTDSVYWKKQGKLYNLSTLQERKKRN